MVCPDNKRYMQLLKQRSVYKYRWGMSHLFLNPTNFESYIPGAFDVRHTEKNTDIGFKLKREIRQ